MDKNVQKLVPKPMQVPILSTTDAFGLTKRKKNKKKKKKKKKSTLMEGTETRRPRETEIDLQKDVRRGGRRRDRRRPSSNRGFLRKLCERRKRDLAHVSKGGAKDTGGKDV